MDGLAERLDAFMGGLMERADPKVVRTLAEAAEKLASSGVTEHALREGDVAPDFALPDQTGRTVTLHELSRTGPVVLTFFRGGWCPFCALTLRALDEIRPELRRLGGELVAISPQTPDRGLDTAERNFLSFPVLTDAGNEVARRYGLVWQLGPELRSLYERLGHPLTRVNASEDWTLPIPAGFVVGQDGRIAHAHVDTRLTRRLEPKAALEAARRLAPAGCPTS